MRTIEVLFTEAEMNDLINKVCDMAENEPKCFSKFKGHEFEPFNFNDELFIIASVLINDGFAPNGKPVRHTSTNIKLVTVEGFYPVASNLDYLFEDRINKALIDEFHTVNR